MKKAKSRKQKAEKVFLLSFHARGVARFSIVVTAGVVVCAAVLFSVAYARHKAGLRDVQRLADMRLAEYAFTKLSLATGSFAAAANGCSTQGSLLASCDFSAIRIDLSALKDPGRFQYRVQTVPSETGFAVSFVLERKHGSLSAGTHTLTERGIQ